MRYVELAQGIRSSVLGFGCAPVLGAVDAGRATLAIRTALDSGVTHFDLARSYGYGEAEAFVGRQLKGVRDEVVLVTKFGIAATVMARLLGPLKPVVRVMRRRGKDAASNGLMVPTGGRLGRFLHRRLPMTAATMQGSLEKSLRALRTDRVDFLLMHEPTELDRFDELLACAADLKRAGKIRAWGLATMFEMPLSQKVPRNLDLWQTSVPLSSADYERLRDSCESRGMVLFSPLRGAAPDNRAARMRQLWQDFPNAVILCSMFNQAHIRSNAAAAS